MLSYHPSPAGILPYYYRPRSVANTCDSFRPQAFDLILDTGSSDLWVADTSCIGSCPTSAQLFDPTKSSTFKGSTSGTTINYGSGQVSGELAQDVVSMGGFNVSGQGFCMRFCTLNGSSCLLMFP